MRRRSFRKRRCIFCSISRFSVSDNEPVIFRFDSMMERRLSSSADCVTSDPPSMAVLSADFTFLSGIERGNKWPYIDTLVNLATALHTKEYELLKPEEEAVSSDIADIIASYTKDAALYLEKIIPQSLENLRKHYLNE